MKKNTQPRHDVEAAEGSGTRPAVDRSAVEKDGAGRREYNRFGVELDVSVSSEHNFYAGFVENMSVGGLFIATHQLKPIGESVEFSMTLPGSDEPIRGTGEVRWQRLYSETSNVPPGMGIRFHQLDSASLARIEEFLAQREPMFFDED
jgi:uncharacterized protein (TIGR02266 family)